MPSKNDRKRRIAEVLARPFSKGRGRGSAPLSFRTLPEGGMVVITSDGRKLWFTADEVNAAGGKPQEAQSENCSSPQAPRSRFKPSGLMPRQETPTAYNGMPTLIVLPPSENKKPSNGATP